MGKRVGRYSDKIREQAAIEYAINGNISKVARDMDIPKATVRSWSQGDWWVELVTKVHAEKAKQHRAAYSRLVDKSLEAANNGIDKLEGTTLSANDIKALVVTAATSTDKIRLSDGQATSISGKAVGISDLSDQFRKLAATHQLVPKSKVIAGSLSDDDDQE